MQPPSVKLQFDDLFIKKELIAHKKVSEDCDDAEEDQEKEEEGVLELGTLVVQGRRVATRAVRRVRVDQFTHLFFSFHQHDSLTCYVFTFLTVSERMSFRQFCFVFAQN